MQTYIRLANRIAVAADVLKDVNVLKDMRGIHRAVSASPLRNVQVRVLFGNHIYKINSNNLLISQYRRITNAENTKCTAIVEVLVQKSVISAKIVCVLLCVNKVASVSLDSCEKMESAWQMKCASLKIMEMIATQTKFSKSVEERAMNIASPKPGLVNVRRVVFASLGSSESPENVLARDNVSVDLMKNIKLMGCVVRKLARMCLVASRKVGASVARTFVA